jgi:hypothetical protein
VRIATASYRCFCCYRTCAPVSRRIRFWLLFPFPPALGLMGNHSCFCFFSLSPLRPVFMNWALLPNNMTTSFEKFFFFELAPKPLNPLIPYKSPLFFNMPRLKVAGNLLIYNSIFTDSFTLNICGAKVFHFSRYSIFIFLYIRLDALFLWIGLAHACCA